MNFSIESWLSRSLPHELFDRILAITKPFTWTFTRLNLGYHRAFSQISLSYDGTFGYHGAFSRIFLWHNGILTITEPFHEFFFDTMEYRQSRSLFMNFYLTQWNLGYHRAFSWIFLWHNGISAITKPFHEYPFHTMEPSAITEPFQEFFFDTMESTKCTILGEDPFHIYHKEYLHRIRLVKNLAYWFRASFARKRVRSFLF
jgi:hypothetical protein